MIDKLILVHVAVCFFMTGLIWTIQLVHYPAFRYIDMSKFKEFAEFHGRHITPITAFPMILELVTAAWFFYHFKDVFFFINLILIAGVWLSTFFLSVPLHIKLKIARDDRLIEKLVLTNWPRTVLWTLRSSLLFWWISSRFIA